DNAAIGNSLRRRTSLTVARCSVGAAGADHLVRVQGPMMARKPGGWSAPLSRPITLRDGKGLATLADARAFVLALPAADQEHNAWQRAAALLIEAAENGGDVRAATDQVFAAAFMQAMVKLE